MNGYTGLQGAFGRKKDSVFTLNGTTSLQSLAYFYGLKSPVADTTMSVAAYLARVCYGSPRPGDRIVWDRRIELMVLEMEDGVIGRVALRILPGWLPERRDPLPGDDAYNLMRRWNDLHRTYRPNSGL